jgi:hypothetical protein
VTVALPGALAPALDGVRVSIHVLAALLHSNSSSRAGLAAWGAVSSLSSVAALVVGVFLAG